MWGKELAGSRVEELGYQGYSSDILLEISLGILKEKSRAKPRVRGMKLVLDCLVCMSVHMLAASRVRE